LTEPEQLKLKNMIDLLFEAGMVATVVSIVVGLLLNSLYG
jgi:hypothetical protein